MRRWLSILLGLTAALPAVAQVTAVYIDSPEIRITAGQQVQLSALARNPSGNRVASAAFQWTTSNSQILQVDSSGLVTAAGLGIADIFANSGNVRGAIRLQVLPQRIEVTPANLTIPMGSQQQYTAVAYNASGAPIPNAPLVWHVMVLGGFDSTTVPISNAGLVTASTLGSYIVRAAIVYNNNGASQFVREFSGSTSMVIKPVADYAVSLLARSDYAKPVFNLRGRRGAISGNDSGRLTFVGSFDGLSNGLLEWSNNGFSLLASGATPGVLPGNLIYDFDDPSMTSNGDVLVRATSINASPVILLANNSGVQVLVPDQTAADVGVDITSLFTNRFSLSEMGDSVVRANFRYDGSADQYQGIFRCNRGFLNLEASTKDPLPGLNGRVSFDDLFGIDADGVIYFSATVGGARAIYRKEPFKNAVKIIGTGDSFNSGTVNSIHQIAVSRTGSHLYVYGTSSGVNFIARFRGSGSPEVWSSGWVGQLFSANGKSGAIFSGDGGTGYGLYVWNGGQPRPLLIRGRPSPSGEPVQEFNSAFIDSTGRVYSTIRGVNTPWMLVSIQPTAALIAANGTELNFTANLNFSQSLVSGDRTTGLHLTAGGNQFSIFQADRSGLLPSIVVGDKLPGGTTYTGQYPVRKSASGSLYVTTEQATYRIEPSGNMSQVATFPISTSDGVNTNAPFNVSVNDRNQMSFISGTSGGHQRLMRLDGTTSTPIAFFQGSSPYQTQSPSGGVFATLQEQAINEAGQVMLLAQVNGGPSGLFVWDGSWQEVCLLQRCQIGGETITSIGQIRAAANRFCVQMNTRIGNIRIECWEGGTWTNVVKRGDFTPDGTELTSLGTLDVNRNGDVGFVGFTSLGGPSVFVKTSHRFLTVQPVLFPVADGAFLRTVFAIDLRDDGRLYFTAMDFWDRLLAYEARPQ